VQGKAIGNMPSTKADCMWFSIVRMAVPSAFDTKKFKSINERLFVYNVIKQIQQTKQNKL
jgi:hypothetical protein